MMRDCADGNLRDLLPGYVHETLPVAERARVSGHVESCEDCAAEVELIRAAIRAYPAPAVDIRRIVKSLPSAPRGGRSGGRSAGREWVIAAAVGFVVIGAVSVISLRDMFSARPSGGSPNAPPAASATVAATKAAPVPGAPAPVARSTAAAAPKAAAPSISFGGGLSDLTDEQLDTLLAEIDALDALPSAEPETHLAPIVPPGEGGHGAR